MRDAVAEFAAKLAELRLAAGRPSFQRMEYLSKAGKRIRLPRSTAHDAERGIRLPPLWAVLGFVASCRDAAQEAGIEIDDRQFDIVTWQERWSSAKKASEWRQAPSAQPRCARVERYSCGISVEWTDEGPRLYGREVVLSTTETNALLDRWMEKITGFVEQIEAELGAGHPSAYRFARMLSSMRACGDIYGNVAPDEEEMRYLTTELARKFNLFYQFIEIMHVEAGIEHGNVEVPTLFEIAVGGGSDLDVGRDQLLTRRPRAAGEPGPAQSASDGARGFPAPQADHRHA